MGAGQFPPPVLIDECLPKSFAEFFESRGYPVYVVGESLPAGSPDANVVAAALELGAVVVTTDSHFRRMRAAAEGSRRRLEQADRIYFTCEHQIALARMTQLIEVFEQEYRQVKAAYERFFMRITRDSYTVNR